MAPSTPMYDVIVVGARCAGSPLAMLLAQKGHRVLLVDKARFPKDTVSTLFLQPPAAELLQRWGLLDRLARTNSAPITSGRLDFGAFVIEASPTAEVDVTYAPRRTVLDPILGEAASHAGADLRLGFAVKELVFEGDRVIGVRGRETGGPMVEERARIVVGADGVRSLVAREVEAPVYDDRAPRSSTYYTFWSDAQFDGLEIHARDWFGILAAPTNDGLTLVAVTLAVSRFPDARHDVERQYFETLREVPEVADRTLVGTREERFYGMSDIPNFFRKPYGSGWALVGDAGYHKDPITAEGIMDAFVDAERLAEAIHEGLSGVRPMEEALEEHERRRNERVLPFYEFTYGLAALEPAPDTTTAFLEAVSKDPEQSERFFGLFAETTDPAEFFSPDNIVKVMAGA